MLHILFQSCDWQTKQANVHATYRLTIFLYNQMETIWDNLLPNRERLIFLSHLKESALHKDKPCRQPSKPGQDTQGKGSGEKSACARSVETCQYKTFYSGMKSQQGVEVEFQWFRAAKNRSHQGTEDTILDLERKDTKSW